MSSRRLGMLVLALVAVWMVTGSSWHPESPIALAPSIITPEKACAGDLSDWRNRCGTSGDPDDIADAPADDPADSTQVNEKGNKNDSSLLDRVLDAMGSLFGFR